MNVNQVSTLYSTGTQTKAGKKTASTFGSQLSQAISERRSTAGREAQTLFRTLSWDPERYSEWKASQEPQILPDSKGLTEENIAYLKERYSGELSLFQQLEAWETFQAMGVITHTQYMEALGAHYITESTACTLIPGDGSAYGTVKEFCDKVFLPGWLDRLREMDRLEEEQQTLDILFEYVDALVEQAKEENELRVREEQLKYWLDRAN